ncbi:MAG: response regulator transcription factor [Candidatus Pacebacteria bacterium]|nr:response regulator transcription factor [Candidatus Paceibacterota bacterium]
MTKKILIIDDDKIFSKVLRDALLAKEKDAYEVTTAFDGKEGLEIASKVKPDLILCDLVMPNMGGIDFIKQLRSEEWGKLLKVVVVTQISDIEKMSEGLELGIHGYILKSDYSIDEILHQIEEALK